MATIDVDAPLDADIADMAFSGLGGGDTVTIFTELGFKSLIKRFWAPSRRSRRMYPSQFAGRALSTIEDVKKICEEATNYPYIAVDFGDVISLAYTQDEQYDIAAEHSLLNLAFSQEAVLAEMKPMLENTHIPKVIHGAKSAITMLKEYGIALRGVLFDTKLAEYALDPGTKNFTIDKLAGKYGMQGAARLRQPVCTPNRKRRLRKTGCRASTMISKCR